MNNPQHNIYDFIVIGSGFGGSVSAMRLTEKGYSVLVLERGKRFRDQDFPVTNWNLFKYLWFPPLRFFGILQMSIFNDIWVLHGSGVGGGSLMYANVLMEPSDKMFTAPAWSHLADWKTVLSPHYATAKRMLGVNTNPYLWPADHALAEIAEELGTADTFRPAEVAVYFSNPDQEGDLVPDPFFDGEGPQRRGCIHCGGCMVGCRHNAKNTLVKNYLYFAEKWGAEVLAEKQVMNIQPLPASQADGARYELTYRSSTGVVFNPGQTIRARNVIVAAGSLGTTRLLFRCRDETQTLPDISSKLGTMVRTNSEALLGITSRERSVDHSKGIAITSVFMADEVTAVEPVRHPDKASFMRNTALPLVDVAGKSFGVRLLTMLWTIIRHPVDFLHARFFARWPLRSTVLLVMQTEDNMVRLKLGRNLFTLFGKGLVTERDDASPVEAEIPIGHHVTRSLAQKMDAVPQGPFTESLLNLASTAHILGGVPFGIDADEGVIGLNCEVHNYPGLYVVDGSIMPANPGINPSLTITALAEYAMSQIAASDNAQQHQPFMVELQSTAK